VGKITKEAANMTGPDRELEVVVWGATGFTGRLTAEHLLGRYGATGDLRWALGGRSRAKLEAVRKQIGAETGRDTSALPLLVGDARDEGFVAELAQRSRVVCTTVGPYARYGSELVAACAAHGTHYCDLTGEVQWMQRMIDAHQDEAARTGACLVFTCGFDSIPSDLGAWFLQREMQARHGVPCSRVQLRVVGSRGGLSGGTVASMLNMLEEGRRDPSVMRAVEDPYALNSAGHRSGPDRPERASPWYDEAFGQWCAPFVMAGINTKVVRRSNELLGYRYGADFRYDEGMLMGAGPLGLAKASGVAGVLAAAMAGLSRAPLRRLVAGRLPQPGEGPSKEQRETGYFSLRLRGEHPDDPAKALFAQVRGDRDPGYGATARMLGESAVCLAREARPRAGGCSTPAAAMGDALLARLAESAGVSFALEDS
jgi:short subunit dehydrogenase-like uncharacterized protein